MHAGCAPMAPSPAGAPFITKARAIHLKANSALSILAGWYTLLRAAHRQHHRLLGLLRLTARATPPEGQFSTIDTAGLYTLLCAAHRQHHHLLGQQRPRPEHDAPEGQFSCRHDLGQDFNTCGLRTDNTIACWGNNRPRPERHHLKANSAAVTAGGDFNTCGLRTDNTIACWGSERPRARRPHSPEIANSTR